MDKNNTPETVPEVASDEQVDGEKTEKKVKKRERGVKEYQRAIIRIIAFVLILWALLFVFLGLTSMPNGDMDPNICAVEGDVVEVTKDGVLLVNGNAVYESKIFDKVTEPYVSNSAPTYPLTLGKDECFVLGDKRSEATDSRIFGPVLK